MTTKPKGQKPVAVIVGASSGIGYHTATALEEKGYTVYNLSRGMCDCSNTTCPSVCNITCDVKCRSNIHDAIGAVIEVERRIDALVYSAGYSIAAPLEYTSQKDFHHVFDINYFGFITVLKDVIPIMRQNRSGRIVAVGSLAGSVPIAFDAPYSASKAALESTIRALNLELKPFNIKASCVCPGGVSTNFTFKRKVYAVEEMGEYADAMGQATRKLTEIEQSGLPPEAVAQAIVGLIQKVRPRASCSVGLGGKAAKMASKVLPERLVDTLNSMMYK